MKATKLAIGLLLSGVVVFSALGGERKKKSKKDEGWTTQTKWVKKKTKVYFQDIEAAFEASKPKKAKEVLEEGLAEAFDKGRSTGRRKGIKKGVSKARENFQKTKEEWLREAFERGKKDGYQKGFKAGEEQGRLATEGVEIEINDAEYDAVGVELINQVLERNQELEKLNRDLEEKLERHRKYRRHLDEQNDPRK